MQQHVVSHTSQYTINTTITTTILMTLSYQCAAIVFLDGGRVSKGLVMVGLAFHLSVIGTVISASVLLCQVKNFFIP